MKDVSSFQATFSVRTQPDFSLTEFAHIENGTKDEFVGS